MRWISFILFYTYVSYAQDSLDFKLVLNKQKGLSSNEVLCLFQDSRGFLWIGTRDGLNRYDGTEVIKYKHIYDDSTTLPGESATCILEDKEGFLWIGTNRGISKFNPANGKCNNYTEKNGKLLHGGDWTNLFYDHYGDLWANCLYGGLYKFDQKENTFIRKISFEFTGWNMKSSSEFNDIIFIAGCNGFFKYNICTETISKIIVKTKFDSIYKVSSCSCTKLYSNDNKTLWIGSWGYGLLSVQLDSNILTQYLWTPNPRIIGYDNIVSNIKSYSDNNSNKNLLIASNKGILTLAIDSNNNFRGLLKCIPGITSANTIYFKDQNIWVGGGNGLFNLSQKPKIIKEFLNLASKVEDFFRTSSGKFLISGSDPALTITDSRGLNRKVYSNLSYDKSNPEGLVSWVAVENPNDNLIYAGSFDGLTAIDSNGEVVRYYRYKKGDSLGLRYRKITHILPLSDGKLLIGFWQRGAQIFDTKYGLNIKIIFEEGIIRKIRKSKDGNIFILCEGSIIKVNPITYQSIRLPVQSEEIAYNDMFNIDDTLVFIGNTNGILLYNILRDTIIQEYNKRNSLLPFEVFGIFKDSLNRLWLKTDEGLILFIPELEVYYKLSEIDKKFGEIGPMNQFSDGSLWFEKNKSLYRLKPELFRTPASPMVYITGLKINEKDTLPEIYFENLKEMRLQPGQNDITIRFTSIDIDGIKNISFEYILEGIQKDWVRHVNYREVAFSNLSSGVYTFRVRPYTANGVSDHSASLKLIITNHLWERNWFRALVTIAVVFAFSYFIFLVKTKNMKIKAIQYESEINSLKKIEIEKTRIARDLHDDLGSNISALRLITELTKNKLRDLDAMNEMNKVVEMCTALGNKIKEVIWVTNSKNDSLDNLIGFLQYYTENILESIDIEYREILPDTIPQLLISGEQRKMILLTFKEAVNNAAKHSRAKLLEIHYKFKEAKLIIIIKDNGCGFNNELLSDVSRQGSGNGLPNMIERMNSIGGDCIIDSKVGIGTMVSICINFES